MSPFGVIPHTTNTRPSLKSTPFWLKYLWRFMEPVTVHIPVVGSYTSTDINPCGQLSPTEGYPPNISTRPSSRRRPVVQFRGTFRTPVSLHVPVDGSYSWADSSEC